MVDSKVRDRSLAALGIHDVEKAVASRANTPGGKTVSVARSMAQDRKTAEQWLDETAAMLALMEARPDFDIEPCEDVTRLLRQAVKAVTLSGADLRLLVPVLKTGARLAVIIGENDSVEIDPIRVDIPDVHGMAELIVESIDEDGQVRADATPGIERLHKTLNSLRRSIQAKASGILKDARFEPMLQDDYVTLRDNRFVLPIKAEHKHHVEGIIHDSSNSGQTFYIEPKALVELNNRMRTVEMELSDEIDKLLSDLTAMVAEEAQTIGAVYQALCKLDMISARARFALDYNCVRPSFTTRISLKNVAHPVMTIEGKNIIGNDIVMPEGACALIISGPNTGGKTVALSTTGLVAVMARMGLFIPAQEGSGIPFYRDIYADIGDSQSITDDLSTFSGHLVSINEIMNNAGASSLVLLDELMINTDPKEGSALAAAVVDRLTEHGADVVVTTHFHELKTLAQTEPMFHNVSMEFDVKEAAPTYRMIVGVPGESSAIAVAEKLLMDEAVISSAKARLLGGDRKIEQVLAELRDQQTQMELARRKTAEALAQAERMRAEAGRARQELARQRDEMAKNAKRKLSGHILSTRRALNDLLEKAKAQEASRDVIKQSIGQLESIAAETRDAAIPEEKISREKLKAGDRVYIIPLEQRGVLDSAPEGGKVNVTMGSIRMSVAVKDVVGIGNDVKPARLKKIESTVFHEETLDGRGETRELNILGMRVDAALDAVEKFLDTAFCGQETRLLIIHGKGTGALREAVRDYLSSSPYVSDYKSASPGRGGEGATFVMLQSC